MLVFFLLAAEPDFAAQAATAVVEMKAAMKPLQKLVDDSDKKDAVRQECVAVKVGQARGLLRIAEQAEATLASAIARKDTEAIMHESRKISIAATKAQQVAKDARACVGELSKFSGDTKVIVEFSGAGIPDPTVTTLLNLLAPRELLRPAQVSPYQ